MAVIGEQMVLLKQCFQSYKTNVEKQQVTQQPESSVHTCLKARASRASVLSSLLQTYCDQKQGL